MSKSVSVSTSVVGPVALKLSDIEPLSSEEREPPKESLLLLFEDPLPSLLYPYYTLIIPINLYPEIQAKIKNFGKIHYYYHLFKLLL